MDKAWSTIAPSPPQKKKTPAAAYHCQYWGAKYIGKISVQSHKVIMCVLLLYHPS